MTKKGINKGVYAVTPDEYNTSHLLKLVSEVLSAHPALLQYRSKHIHKIIRYEQAEAILNICRLAGVPLIINDDLTLALEIGADGVHLGRDDGNWLAARSLLGEKRILGVSCYDQWPDAIKGVRAGADYVAFGALFPSSVKPDAVRAPLSLLRRARKELDVVVVGIGGITLNNVDEVVAAGADCVAVISDIFSSPVPAETVKAYQERFSRVCKLD